MDRTRTTHEGGLQKRPRRAGEPSKKRSAQIWALVLILALCVAGVALLTRGSSAERLLQLGLPLMRGAALAIPPSPAPDAVPIAIARVDVDEGVGERMRESMRIEVLNPKPPKAVELGGGEPRILIYHTHTTEAYRQTDTYTYTEAGEWRTKEQDKSIVAVGALLAKVLSEEYGCNVIHDTTDHEPPKLRTSYDRSLETMLAYKKQYPSLTLFIDVHRDSGKSPVFTTIDGKRVARMMFVVGTGEGATGTGFKEMPDFEANFALANAITERLHAVDASLMRNIRVKTSRYNQHVSNQCLLVEMGDNMNTLEEALNAVPHLARAVVQTLDDGVPAMADTSADTSAGTAADTPASTPTPAPELLWAPRA